MIGEHVSALATESTTIAAIVFFVMAWLVAMLAWATGRRKLHIVLPFAAFMLMSLYFALLAITTGPAPKINRGDVATFLRILLLIDAGTWAATGISIMLYLLHRVGFRIRRNHVQLALILTLVLVFVGCAPSPQAAPESPLAPQEATRLRSYMTWNEAVQASSIGLECHVIDKAASAQRFDYCLHVLPDGMTIRITRNAATGQTERNIIALVSPLPTPLPQIMPASPLALPAQQLPMAHVEADPPPTIHLLPVLPMPGRVSGDVDTTR